MYTLHLEHGITSFETWKAAFDRDPAQRQASGVLSYRVLSPTDDPNTLVIDLEFEQLAQARAFQASLEQIWSRVEQSPGLARSSDAARPGPRARILEGRLSHRY